MRAYHSTLTPKPDDVDIILFSPLSEQKCQLVGTKFHFKENQYTKKNLTERKLKNNLGQVCPLFAMHQLVDLMLDSTNLHIREVIPL